MKWMLLWLVPALLILPASLLPWAHKEVYDMDCSTSWDGVGIRTECAEDDWVVDYKLLSMATVHEWRDDDGTGWGPLKRDTTAISYHSDLPNAEGATPLLWLGPLIVSGTAAAAGGTAWVLLRPNDQTMLLARIAWVAHLLGVLIFLAGIGIHSGTWRGDEVTLLAPRWGLLAVAGTLLVGVPLLPERRDAPLGMPPLPS